MIRMALCGLAAMVVFLGGCAAQVARDQVGVPAVAAAIEGESSVVADAFAGVMTLPEPEQANAAAKVKAFEAALQSRDIVVMRLDAKPRWNDVKGYATSGIDARVAKGEIGPGVAASLKERLERFGETLDATTGE